MSVFVNVHVYIRMYVHVCVHRTLARRVSPSRHFEGLCAGGGEPERVATTA